MEETTTFAGTIVDTFVDSFTKLGTGIADGFVDMFESVFVTSTGGISNIAIWGLVALASGLVIGIVRKLTNKAG